MWLITPVGFFSIVQKPDDKQAGTLTIRARVHGDLAALKLHYLPGMGPIKESSDADYRFRATAPRKEVSAATARLIDEIDYSNFKSEVARLQGHARSNLYHDVWSVLYKLQTAPEFKDKELSADSYGGVFVSGGNRVVGGHERDIAILDAGEKSFTAIPRPEHTEVQPEGHRDQLRETVTADVFEEKHTIVKVGGEGGELALVGIRIGEVWRFRVESNEAAMSGFLDDDDQIAVPEKPWVETWRSGLKQLDCYPWTELYPLEVHEEFRVPILEELQSRQKKGVAVDRDHWGRALGMKFVD